MHISEKTRGLLSRKALALAKVCLLLLISAALPAQQDAGTGLPDLIRANERFGANLLLHVHSTQPERNVALSPLSLTLAFAAIREGKGYGPASDEVGAAFGWNKFVRLNVPARMLLAAFDKPEPFKRATGKISLRNPSFLARPPEGARITNIFLYRALPGKEPISPRFVTMAHRYYGVEFRSIGSEYPTEASLKANEHVTTSVPRTSSANDILITSGTHLQTAWRWNTFSESEPHIGAFQTKLGTDKKVQVLDSETESYLYAKTDRVEAVVLPCNDGYMLAVLPALAEQYRSWSANWPMRRTRLIRFCKND
jgi:serine protease inhibitor